MNLWLVWASAVCACHAGRSQTTGEPVGVGLGGLEQSAEGSGEGAGSQLLVAGPGRLQLLTAGGTVVGEVAVAFTGAAMALAPGASGVPDEALVLAVDGSLHRVSLPALAVRPLGENLDAQNACLTDSPASWLLGFGVLPAGDALCVELSRDEWDQGRTYTQVRVSLADGSQAATTTVDVGPIEGVPAGDVPFGSCAPLAGTPICRIDHGELIELSAEALGLGIDPATCHLLGPGLDLEIPSAATGSTAEPCDLQLHGRSASGRYLAVSTYLGEGDYVHRQLRIADLETARLVEGLSADVVYSSHLAWAPDHEALVVNSALWSLGTTPHATDLTGPAVFVQSSQP